jgi:hypothetical protein
MNIRITMQVNGVDNVYWIAMGTQKDVDDIKAEINKIIARY